MHTRDRRQGEVEAEEEDQEDQGKAIPPLIERSEDVMYSMFTEMQTTP